MRRGLAIATLVVAASLPVPAQEDEEPALPEGLGTPTVEDEEKEEEKEQRKRRLPGGLHGFVEGRVGPRIHDDPATPEDFTLGEVRVQADYRRAWKRVSLDATGDLLLDAVLEEVVTDLRQLRLTLRPPGPFDLRVGRQILTWGTGDLLFINDLFPKDWQSFFIGRDEDYLKAPSDTLRVGWFAKKLNVDLAYTPRFEPDRHIRGERISLPGGSPLYTIVPDDAFDDDEVALRVHGNAGSYEIAGYAYRGFWKSPAGFDAATSRGIFPVLDVWGASVRGPVGPGIGNIEVGYYDSRDDTRGDDPLVNNGEVRALVGYETELARELTGGFQYYLEHMLDHDRYLATLPAGTAPRDENRHVVTARITRLLKAQTLIPSVFVYYSPSDRDGYVRPRFQWKRTDHQTIELGLNLFFGREPHTFFGQFEDASNVYASIRFQ